MANVLITDRELANMRFSLTLTLPQRQALVRNAYVETEFKTRMKEMGRREKTIQVGLRTVDEINDYLDDLRYDVSDDDKELLAQIEAKMDEIAVIARAKADKITAKKIRACDPATPVLVYEFKISFRRELQIWRRIQVHDCTLDYLHKYIAAAFNLRDDVVYEFVIKKASYGTGSIQVLTEWDEVEEQDDDDEVELSQLLTNPAKPAKWVYKYDSDDSLAFQVLFEKTLSYDPKCVYPRCIVGSRAGSLNDVFFSGEIPKMVSAGRAQIEALDAVAATERMRTVL